MASLQPVEVYRPGADEEKAETARLSSFVGAIAIGDLVKSTLGPRGMDKLLVSSSKHTAGEVHITNDGATILKAIGVDNPAAKVLVDLAKTQDEEVGDGTTSVTVLAAELLREAEKLIAMKLHPQTIIAGWRKAKVAALETLEQSAVSHPAVTDSFIAELMNIARTTLSSKILHQHRDHFAKLAVDAVLRLHRAAVATAPADVGTSETAKLCTAGDRINLEAIQILKKLGSSLSDSYLEEGFLLDKRIATNSPHRVEKARVLVANTPMDSDKIKIFGSRIRVESVAKVAELEEAEREKMKSKVNKIIESGCNVFINRQLIYNYPEQLLSEKGICVIEHADFDGVERLAFVLGGDIVSTFDEMGTVRLGECAVVEEVLIGEDKLVRFGGVKRGEACTIVLRGATRQILDEAERSLHDALCVLQRAVSERRAVLGGGASEMRMANAVRRASEREAGKQSEAMAAFARALEALPAAIADNAGLDAADLVSQLRAAHAENGPSCTWGLLVNDCIAGDVRAAGIVEAFAVKRAVVQSAAEAAEVILRVDSIIKQAPRPRQRDMRPH